MKITASYTQTTQPTQYEPVKASVTIEVDVPDGQDPTGAITHAQMLCKTQVEQQLGTVTQPMAAAPAVAQTQEVVAATDPFGNVVQSAPPASTQPTTPATPVAATAAAAPATASSFGDNEDAAWWQDLCTTPSNWYDNRLDKRNPKAPDFKHTNAPDPKNPQFKKSLWVSSAPAGIQLPAAGFAGA